MKQKQINKLEIERKELESKKFPYLCISIVGILLCCTLIGIPIGIILFLVGVIGVEPLNKKISEIDTKLNRTTINNFFR